MTALRAREEPAQTRAEVEQLLTQMREANECLLVAALHAQHLSDEAAADTTRARAELDDLMIRLQDANERLATAAAHAEMMAEEAGARQEEYQQLSGRLLILQEEERRRLALDLHDPIGQRLAVLTMNLDVIEGTGEALGARARRALAESRSLAEQCSREVRTFAYLLYPPLLDELGLPAAVRWFVEGFTKRSGIQVTMHLDEIGRLPEPIETALFRVVQESLTNIHRHASTTTASIRLATTAGAVVLEIRDQGHGLGDQLRGQNGTPLSATLGVGIQGMRERIRQLSGTFDVEFTDSGTTVRVSVPLNKGTSMKPVRILIADDHEVVRQGVRTVLEAQAGWIVCGEASTGREAVAKAVDLRPDIVILDVGMPELNGLEATRQIRRAMPAKILILTVHESDQVVTEMLDAGADGYMLKTDAGRKLVDAIRALLRDHEFFTERIRPAEPRHGKAAASGHSPRLTPRQREILQLITEGKSNKEIGATLGITTKTAETHRTQIMAKLNLHSMSELVRYAIRNRIIEP